MEKEQQVTSIATTIPKSVTVRIYSTTKNRLQKLVRKKAAKEDREVTEVELADLYINRGLAIDERKLKSA